MTGRSRVLSGTACALAAALVFAACDSGHSGDTAGAGPLDDASTGEEPLPDGGSIPPPVRDAAPMVTCNGLTWLCDRTFDRVVTLGTHGSVTSDDPPWTSWRTQHLALRAQLDAGVRAVLLETHRAADGTLVACLWDCARGSVLASEPLATLAAFLEVNPREVVTLVLDNSAPRDDVIAAVRAAGLDGLAYAKPAGAPWPTLGAMIAAGHRLVVLARDGAGAGNDAGVDAGNDAGDDAGGDAGVDASAAPNWYLPFSAFAQETTRSAASPEALASCALEADDAASEAPSITLLHAYVVANDGDGGPAPSPESVAQAANTLAALESTRTQCLARGFDVTIVDVDFFASSDARAFVISLDEADAAP